VEESLMPSNTLKFAVSERDRKSGNLTELGELEFVSQPRVGEFVTRDVSGATHAFLVVAVFHSDKPASTAGEIWIEDRGTLVDLKKPNSAGSFGFLN
jgi:hypothetical protein